MNFSDIDSWPTLIWRRFINVRFYVLKAAGKDVCHFAYLAPVWYKPSRSPCDERKTTATVFSYAGSLQRRTVQLSRRRKRLQTDTFQSMFIGQTFYREVNVLLFSAKKGIHGYVHKCTVLQWRKYCNLIIVTVRLTGTTDSYFRNTSFWGRQYKHCETWIVDNIYDIFSFLFWTNLMPWISNNVNACMSLEP